MSSLPLLLFDATAGGGFLPRTPKREGIFSAYLTGLIHSRVPTLHKLCVTICTHKLQHEQPYSCKQCGNVFYSPLLNARELNRHIWQARCRHGPEQYSHIFPQIRRLRFRPYAAFFASTSAHTLASNAELVFYSPLLNAKELNRHIWQARCRHGP